MTIGFYNVRVTGDSDNSNFGGMWERSPFGVNVEENWRWGISTIGRVLLQRLKREMEQWTQEEVEL